MKNEFAKQCIRYQLPFQINVAPALTTDEIVLVGLVIMVITQMISKYRASCTVKCFELLRLKLNMPFWLSYPI